MRRQIKRFNRNEKKERPKKSKQSNDSMSHTCMMIEQSTLKGMQTEATIAAAAAAASS